MISLNALTNVESIFVSAHVFAHIMDHDDQEGYVEDLLYLYIILILIHYTLSIIYIILIILMHEPAHYTSALLHQSPTPSLPAGHSPALQIFNI